MEDTETKLSYPANNTGADVVAKGSCLRNHGIGLGCLE